MGSRRVRRRWCRQDPAICRTVCRRVRRLPCLLARRAAFRRFRRAQGVRCVRRLRRCRRLRCGAWLELRLVWSRWHSPKRSVGEFPDNPERPALLHRRYRLLLLPLAVRTGCVNDLGVPAAA